MWHQCNHNLGNTPYLLPPARAFPKEKHKPWHFHETCDIHLIHHPN